MARARRSRCVTAALPRKRAAQLALRARALRGLARRAAADAVRAPAEPRRSARQGPLSPADVCPGSARGTMRVPGQAIALRHESAGGSTEERDSLMCGIAGLSIAPGVEIDATATARLLLAGLAERGQDATGYAFHDADGRRRGAQGLGPAVRVHRAPRAAVARPHGDHARPRLHQGPPRAERQQPPDPVRPRRRRAQRAPDQRRRALRGLRHAALDAADHASTPRRS